MKYPFPVCAIDITGAVFGILGGLIGFFNDEALAGESDNCRVT